MARNETEKTALEGEKITPVMTANERIYNMLFENVEFDNSMGRPYYLASRGVLAVRPVVSLKSSVTTKDIQKNNR